MREAVKKIKAENISKLKRVCLSLAKTGGALCVCIVSLVILSVTNSVHAQGSYMSQGTEYGPAGSLIGDQVFPNTAIKTTGGYVVWEDGFADGEGLGIFARKLDSSLSGSFSPFRVNQIGTNDQERASVAILNDGGAVFVWQGGRQGFQHIYARIRSSSGVWITGDTLVSTATNVYQKESVVATLGGSNSVVAWASYNQASANSMQDLFFQILTPTGAKVGAETRMNVTTAFNQRSVSISSLTDGRFVAAWISEQQRFENSVDVYARIFSSSGVPETGEILINTATNICASPTLARSADGGFLVAWMERDLNNSSNSWDIIARPFSGGGFGGTVRRVNNQTYGDQLDPKASSINSDYAVVWTSMGQDGSRDGIYGQMLASDGALTGGEFRINTTTLSQQIQPVIASDNVSTFLAVWTSFGGGANSFDLRAQRFANTNQPINPPAAPIVTVISSSALSVTWPPVQGLNISDYEVYADGSSTATAVVTNTFWNATALAASSTHYYKLAYVLVDGRRSPLSAATTNTTYGSIMYSGIPAEWMALYFGEDWPLANADSDGDGVSNKTEFLAGTDPTSAASVLKQSLRQTPLGLFLDWNTQPGLIYQVQSAGTPGGSWINIGGPRFASGNTDSIFVGGSGSAFYRVSRLR